MGDFAALSDNLAASGLLLVIVPTSEEMVDDLPETTELGLAFCGDDDKMRVGAHQAVGSDENAVTGCVFFDEVQKEALSGVELEDVREVVATPSAVVS